MSIKIEFVFFSAFLDLQSIRDDENTTSSKKLIYNYFTENTSWSCELWQSNDVPWKVQAFQKISEISRFRSFELPIIRKDFYGPWHFE